MTELITTVLPIVKDGGLLVFGNIFNNDVVSFDSFVNYLRSLHLNIEPKYYDINNTIERFVGVRKAGNYQPPIESIEIVEPVETIMPSVSLMNEDIAIHKQLAENFSMKKC